MRTFPCTADTIARWAEVAQDHNPLHLDASYAAGTRFGMPIVHGHLLACVVVDELQRQLGESLVTGGGVSVRFRAPVSVGLGITIAAESGGTAPVGERRPPAVTATCDGTEVLAVEVALGPGEGTRR